MQQFWEWAAPQRYISRSYRQFNALHQNAPAFKGSAFCVMRYEGDLMDYFRWTILKIAPGFILVIRFFSRLLHVRSFIQFPCATGIL